MNLLKVLKRVANLLLIQNPLREKMLLLLLENEKTFCNDLKEKKNDEIK